MAVGWPHAPSRQVMDAGTYMITSGTARKEHLWNTPEKLDLLQSTLFSQFDELGWKLEAWAFLSNHYHIIVRVAEEPPLGSVMQKLHSRTAILLNQHDRVSGRRVWANYWQSKLTIETSYLARLAYVHQNPVRHGLVKNARDYPWCSYRWFEDGTEQAWFRTVLSFKIDSVNVPDQF